MKWTINDAERTRSCWGSWLVSLLVCATSLAAADDSAGLERLRWLEGCWDAESSTRQAEECWSEPAGGMMLGYGRVIGSTGRAGFEYLRLVDEGGTVVYIAQPGGGAAIAFTATEIQPGFVRFSNPEHDYPRVIEYRREGDRLTAAIGEGAVIDESESVTYFRFIQRDD